VLLGREGRTSSPGDQRHHRRARAGGQALAQGLQRRPVGVRVRRRREDHGPRPARRDVPFDHRLRAAQARPGHAGSQRLLPDDERLTWRSSTRWA
jgi:hypothetical protein